MKPFSESCEQNKEPIFKILQNYFTGVGDVLEIGSGTGQHAVYFAEQFPHLNWITSDVRQNHGGIKQWLDEAGRENISGPLELDVDQSDWPVMKVDAVFSANTVHIMAWDSVVNMFNGITRLLKPQALFCLYGPFNYNGMFTSESNRNFDHWLKQRDPRSGIRDFEALLELATENDMTLVADHDMPANNRTLVWQKVRVIEK